MCIELEVDGETITNVDALRAKLGACNVVILPGYGNVDGGCLCPVDLKSTARKSGRRVVPVDKVFAVYELERVG